MFSLKNLAILTLPAAFGRHEVVIYNGILFFSKSQKEGEMWQDF